MSTKIGKLGINLFKDIESIEKLWSEFFGAKFQNVWCDPEIAIKKAVDFARNTIEGSADIQEGASHSTLFMRDPLTDRLNLEYSTKSELNKGSGPPSDMMFKDKRQNYNDVYEECFYNLCDSLFSDNDKKSDIARETRGLTGWVALTGIPLRVNSARSQESLEDMIKENSLAEQLCEKYGLPKWGHRISEFLRPNNAQGWSKRFMAVPIKSIIDTNKTIGVLRYCCPLKSKELTQLDLLVFESVAELISTLKNIKQVRILCNRDNELEKEQLSFQQSGDFSSFLAFIAYALRSRICSLYIALNIKGNNMLRLVDAYGISGYTGDVRADIKDYSANEGGLTFEILGNPDLTPTSYSSVVKSEAWRGRNTKLFYGKALGELSIPDLDKNLKNETNWKPLLTRHPIKLLGCSLRDEDNPIGVLKVEFPKIYDDSQHYEDADKIFFRKCAEVLRKELLCYQNFINGEWFKDAKEDKVDEFIRYMSQIYRFKLIKKEDNLNDFWENAEKYALNFTTEIQKVNIARLKKKSEINKSYLIMLKDITKVKNEDKEWGWMKKTFISESIKQLVDKAVYFTGEAIKYLT